MCGSQQVGLQIQLHAWEEEMNATAIAELNILKLTAKVSNTVGFVRRAHGAHFRASLVGRLSIVTLTV